LNSVQDDYSLNAVGETVNVSLSGDETILDCSSILLDGMELTGYYQGVLQPFD